MTRRPLGLVLALLLTPLALGLVLALELVAWLLGARADRDGGLPGFVTDADWPLPQAEPPRPTVADTGRAPGLQRHIPVAPQRMRMAEPPTRRVARRRDI